MKDYADKRRRTRERSLKIGDKVIVLHKNLKTSFKPDVYTVEHMNGSQVRVRKGNHTMVRNSSFLKVVFRAQEHRTESYQTMRITTWTW